MSLAEYKDGILLIEPLLGAGYFDLPKIVSTVRTARPQARFTLEMISRNPLKVPVLTDRYWAPFPDRRGLALARTLALARSRGWKGPLPDVEQLPHEERLRVEEVNVSKCPAYASNQLALG